MVIFTNLFSNSFVSRYFGNIVAKKGITVTPFDLLKIGFFFDTTFVILKLTFSHQNKERNIPLISTFFLSDEKL